MAVTLTRSVTFRASHRLYRPEWSDAENQKRFGWTADPPGHHHDYRCAITVSGPLDAETTTVLDLAHLDTLLSEHLVQPLAGSYLNNAIPSFRSGKMLPTCEGVATWIAEQLGPLLSPVRLESVRVAEDETLHAEWHRTL